MLIKDAWVKIAVGNEPAYILGKATILFGPAGLVTIITANRNIVTHLSNVEIHKDADPPPTADENQQGAPE